VCVCVCVCVADFFGLLLLFSLLLLCRLCLAGSSKDWFSLCGWVQ